MRNRFSGSVAGVAATAVCLLMLSPAARAESGGSAFRSDVLLELSPLVAYQAETEEAEADGAMDSGASEDAESDLDVSPEVQLEPATVIAGAETGETPVGPYGQPAWTARQQRWGTTRAYVLPPYTFELEGWWVGDLNENEKPSHEFLQELKIGLPYRLQLDLYQMQQDPAGDTFDYKGTKVELRWALADWGEIPLNPTLYWEWEHEVGHGDEEDEDGLEYKLLLAETLAPQWHAATNLIFEHSLREDKIEYGASFGLSRTIVENAFSVGMEGEFIREEEGDEKHNEALLGPSFEWRPTDATSLRVAPLFGLNDHAPDAKLFVIFGFEFGPGYSGEGFGGPSATEIR